MRSRQMILSKNSDAFLWVGRHGEDETTFARQWNRKRVLLQKTMSFQQSPARAGGSGRFDKTGDCRVLPVAKRIAPESKRIYQSQQFPPTALMRRLNRHIRDQHRASTKREQHHRAILIGRIPDVRIYQIRYSRSFITFFSIHQHNPFRSDCCGIFLVFVSVYKNVSSPSQRTNPSIAAYSAIPRVSYNFAVPEFRSSARCQNSRSSWPG